MKMEAQLKHKPHTVKTCVFSIIQMIIYMKVIFQKVLHLEIKYYNYIQSNICVILNPLATYMATLPIIT